MLLNIWLHMHRNASRQFVHKDSKWQVKDIFLKAIYQLIHPSSTCHWELWQSCKAYKNENEQDETPTVMLSQCPRAKVVTVQTEVSRRAERPERKATASVHDEESGRLHRGGDDRAGPYQVSRKKCVRKTNLEATTSTEGSMCKGTQCWRSTVRKRWGQQV